MILILTSFMLVALRGFQQQNVIHGYYKWAVGTTWLLAIAEVTTMLYVVQTGWSSIPYVATGGSLGIVSAMYFHKHYIRKEKR